MYTQYYVSQLQPLVAPATRLQQRSVRRFKRQQVVCRNSDDMGKPSTALSKRLHAYVSGRVQGVFFRCYTKAKGTELGLTGWVRNRRDGRVEVGPASWYLCKKIPGTKFVLELPCIEVVAEGYEGDLQQLLTWLHTGAPQADVSGVEAAWSAATGEFDDFDTLWTA